MISIDTNILFHAYNIDASKHHKAHTWLTTLQERRDIVISEFVLFEFYRLLRNPKASTIPLDAPTAASVIESYRDHPNWKLVGFPENSRAAHDRIWSASASPQFAYRKIYDYRIAVTIQTFGVQQFATENIKDFKDLGFQRVWNPLENEQPS